ncbi:MAG: protein tyrosine phosphatase family protein [Leptolyngbya sp. BL-A-14]
MVETSIAAIPHYRQLADTIATAGQPTEAQIAAIKAAGYRVVVNLALPTSANALPNEQALVEAQGMTYISIPVVWEEPTLADVQQFFSVMQTHAEQPIFVHCAKNMRVSAFLYLYRRLCQGMDETLAAQDLYAIWKPNDRWQSFIAQIVQYYQQH